MIGASQLRDALEAPTQGATQELATPPAAAAGRPPRDVAPQDPLTYDQQQTRTAQRAAKRGRGRGRGAQPRFKRGRI